MNFNKMLSGLSSEQLLALNKEVCRRLSMRSVEVTDNLRYGDRVTWTDKYNFQHYGKVVKVNRKTVIVVAEKTGGRWRIAGSLLTKANV